MTVAKSGDYLPHRCEHSDRQRIVCPQAPNQFVIGYGMDYAERYRGMIDIRLFPADVVGQ
jgi:hypoxanthine-guanine phosphoribosyltransferase